jgi:hypothetical protein
MPTCSLTVSPQSLKVQIESSKQLTKSSLSKTDLIKRAPLTAWTPHLADEIDTKQAIRRKFNIANRNFYYSSFLRPLGDDEVESRSVAVWVPPTEMSRIKKKVTIRHGRGQNHKTILSTPRRAYRHIPWDQHRLSSTAQFLVVSPPAFLISKIPVRQPD